MPQFKYLVLSNPVEGREDEYNDWYTNVHLADVLKVEGVVSAQRMRCTEVQRHPGPQAWKYMAVYDCEAESVQHVIDGMRARAGTPQMPISSAMAAPVLACFFEPITGVVHSVE